MPRFHFNVQDGRYLPDIDGTELGDLTEARREAVRMAGRLLDDDPAEFWTTGLWKVIVTDHAAHIVFVLTISAAEGDGGSAGPVAP